MREIWFAIVGAIGAVHARSIIDDPRANLAVVCNGNPGAERRLVEPKNAAVDPQALKGARKRTRTTASSEEKVVAIADTGHLGNYINLTYEA